MSFPQLGYPQYLSAAGPGAYGGERPGVLAAAAAAASSGRPGPAELGAGAAAVTSVLGMYAAAGPYAGAPGYSAFLPYAADLGLFSQMVSARPALPGSCAGPAPGRAGGREGGGRPAGSGAAAAPRRRAGACATRSGRRERGGRRSRPGARPAVPEPPLRPRPARGGDGCCPRAEFAQSHRVQSRGEAVRNRPNNGDRMGRGGL